MKTFKQYTEEVKKPTGGLKKACWNGYTAVGMKMKGGRKVPNCVPEEVMAEGQLDEISQDTVRSYAQKATQSKKDLTNQTYRNGADTDKLNKKIQNRQQGLNRAHTDKRYYKDEQGVAEEGMAAGVVPANNVGAGNIAGSGGKGGEPGVNKNKKKGPVLIQMAKRKSPM